jgi:hypothetical protein
MLRRIGQHYEYVDEGIPQNTTYLLCQVESNRVCLMNLGSANRWHDPVTVGDVNNITELEWADITELQEGEYFYLV